MTIDVTQDIIDVGLRRNTNYCPVSTAIARAIPKANMIVVTADAIRYTLDGTRHVHMTPAHIGDYLIAYDAGQPLVPFSFDLDEPVIVPVRPAGARRARTVNTTTSATAYSRSARRYGMRLLRASQPQNDQA